MGSSVVQSYFDVKDMCKQLLTLDVRCINPSVLPMHCKGCATKALLSTLLLLVHCPTALYGERERDRERSTLLLRFGVWMWDEVLSSLPI